MYLILYPYAHVFIGQCLGKRIYTIIFKAMKEKMINMLNIFLTKGHTAWLCLVPIKMLI
jgi:hypothetical protein